MMLLEKIVDVTNPYIMLRVKNEEKTPYILCQFFYSVQYQT